MQATTFDFVCRVAALARFSWFYHAIYLGQSIGVEHARVSLLPVGIERADAGAPSVGELARRHHLPRAGPGLCSGVLVFPCTIRLKRSGGAVDQFGTGGSWAAHQIQYQDPLSQRPPNTCQPRRPAPHTAYCPSGVATEL